MNPPKLRKPQIQSRREMYFKQPYKQAEPQPSQETMSNAPIPQEPSGNQNHEESLKAAPRPRKRTSSRRRKPISDRHDREQSTISESKTPQSNEVETHIFDTTPKPASGRHPQNGRSVTARHTRRGTARIPRALPNSEKERHYVTGQVLGSGNQGIVYEARVDGNQEFEGFDQPVTHVVVKIGKPFDGPVSEHPLLSEIEMSKHATRGLAKLLDQGKTEAIFPGKEKAIYPYAVYEKLSPMKRIPGLLNFATATDMAANLLFQLTYIHKKMALLDIKPENVMLRMPPKRGDTSEQAYIRKVATGQYEPVFVDLGSAMTRKQLALTGGLVEKISSTPLYSPPETANPTAEDKLRIGIPNDIYSWALTFYELLTQQQPYEHRNPQSNQERWNFVIQRDVSPVDFELLEAIADTAPLTVESRRDSFKEGMLQLFEQTVYRRDSSNNTGRKVLADERISAKEAFKLMYDVFGIKDRLPKLNGALYTYDSGKGMKWEQSIFLKKDPDSILRESGEFKVEDFY